MVVDMAKYILVEKKIGDVLCRVTSVDLICFVPLSRVVYQSRVKGWTRKNSSINRFICAGLGFVTSRIM